MSRVKFEKSISYDEARDLYYLYMDLGQDDNGRRVRRYRTFRTLAAARDARDSFLMQRIQTKAVSPSDMTLNHWLDTWMHEIVIPNRAETTIYGYQKIIDNHLSPALGDIPIQKLTPNDLQHYYAGLMQKKGLCANTVRRHHDLLSASLHAALRQDLILRCPTERVEPPRVVSKEAHYSNSAELKTLYQLVENHWLEPIVHLAGSLGLRREEICGLRWDSVDFQLRRIHIRAARTMAGGRVIEKETKNRSSTRILYMGDDIYQLLTREQQRQAENQTAFGTAWCESGFVIVDQLGVPLRPNHLSLAFTHFVHSHELPPLTLHGLRHTFATVASAQGAPLFDIGKALGHSTPATTGRIYTHLTDQLHTDTLAKVAAALQ